MFGIILIDKPLEMTSHDVVAILRGRFKTKRIGHSGTLDPMATGLLVVAVGPATRFLQFLPLEPKIYRAEVHFGKTTASYDQEGDVTDEQPIPSDLLTRLVNTLPTFLGTQAQLPPMFSAVKVNGQPLYKHARQGVEIERKPRDIHIERIDLLEFNEDKAVIEVECSGGTYVRTLAHDLGQAVGCGAYLSNLVRTQVGEFTLEGAQHPKEATLDRLIPLAKALQPMPSRELSEAELFRVRNGNPVPNTIIEDGHFCMLVDNKGQVMAVAHADGNVLQPECVLPTEAFDDAL